MKLALGTAQFDSAYGIASTKDQYSLNKIIALLAQARAVNIDTIDTAISYGESERLLGEAGLSCWQVITKLPAIPNSCSDIQAWISTNIDLSLARLKISSLRGVLLHRPSQLLSRDGQQIYQALMRLKATGKVEKIGVSIYEPSELDDLCKYYDFDLIQSPLNIFDRRLVTSGWLQRLYDEGIEVHTRSSFLQGLLLMPRTALPVWFEQWPEVWTKWYEWLSRYRISALQACLSYPLSLAHIDRVVVGVDNSDQLAQIISLKALQTAEELPDFQLSDEKLLNPALWQLS